MMASRNSIWFLTAVLVLTMAVTNIGASNDCHKIHKKDCKDSWARLKSFLNCEKCCWDHGYAKGSWGLLQCICPGDERHL